MNFFYALNRIYDMSKGGQLNIMDFINICMWQGDVIIIIICMHLENQLMGNVNLLQCIAISNAKMYMLYHSLISPETNNGDRMKFASVEI